jgi:hypothetical protein
MKKVTSLQKYRACKLHLAGVSVSEALASIAHPPDKKNTLLLKWLAELQSLKLFDDPTLAPYVGRDIKQTFKSFHALVKHLFPQGSSKRGFPVLIGNSRLRIVFFYRSDETADFGLFLSNQRYSRMTLTIYPDGRVTDEDNGGVILEWDKTQHEPDFRGMGIEEIALAVALQMKALL